MAGYPCRCGERIEDVEFPNPKIFHAVRDDDIERIQHDLITWVRDATDRGQHLREDFETDLFAAIGDAFDGPLHDAHPDLGRERLFLICPECGRLHLVSHGDDTRWDQITWQLEEGNPWAIIEPSEPLE